MLNSVPPQNHVSVFSQQSGVLFQSNFPYCLSPPPGSCSYFGEISTTPGSYSLFMVGPLTAQASPTSNSKLALRLALADQSAPKKPPPLEQRLPGHREARPVQTRWAGSASTSTSTRCGSPSTVGRCWRCTRSSSSQPGPLSAPRPAVCRSRGCPLFHLLLDCLTPP